MAKVQNEGERMRSRGSRGSSSSTAPTVAANQASLYTGKSGGGGGGKSGRGGKFRKGVNCHYCDREGHIHPYEIIGMIVLTLGDVQEAVLLSGVSKLYWVLSVMA
jgi:hypothetical protein